MMKLYKYNPKTLRYESVSYIRNILRTLFFIFILFTFLDLSTVKYETTEVDHVENISLIHYPKQFSEDDLVDLLKEINFKHPHIVLAQMWLETGHFESPIFMENNNLMGMKEAKVRLNLAKGTNNGHAYYDTWEESVLDYSLYYATYLHGLDEDKVFQYLKQYYAQDPKYVKKLKQLIRREKLKERFEVKL